VIFSAILLYAVVFYGARKIARAEQVAENERIRSDALLTNMRPLARISSITMSRPKRSFLRIKPRKLTPIIS
jgi:hypothetical protein